MDALIYRLISNSVKQRLYYRAFQLQIEEKQNKTKWILANCKVAFVIDVVRAQGQLKTGTDVN